MNPVAEGIVAAEQDRLKDDANRERVIPLLIHGDAAMAGQGIVAETMNLFAGSRLRHRRNDSYGGQQPDRVHDESGARGDPRPIAPTSRWRFRLRCFMSMATIRRRACASMQLSFDYRQRFHKDVVIDLMCYRKYGHNEADDPSYTQPIMYRKIRAQKPVAEQLCRAAGAGGSDFARRGEEFSRGAA